jgi:hypothetical protein
MDDNPDNNYTLSQVFNESYFTIPEYQRDYAWQKENVNDLLDDIDFVYTRNKAQNSDDEVDHYFGTLVFEKKGSIDPRDYEEYTEFAIVDGQQRMISTTIFILSIIEEIEYLTEKDDIDEDMKEDMTEYASDIRSKYVEYEDIPRLEIDGLAENAYTQIVIEQQSPEKFLSYNKPVEAERRVVKAKKVIKSRLSDWKKKKCEKESGDTNALYYKLLKNIIRILTQRFKVNVKTVDDVDEAARMFKVINNRGRGLALHDKIRSHLVYCASQSESLDSEYIYNQFNDVVQNLTVHDGFSDSEVDQLVKDHWIIFANERSDTRAKRSGPVDIHKRLSDINEFANVQRSDFENFIEPYIESLQSLSEEFPYLSDRDKFSEKYIDSEDSNLSKSKIQEISRKIQVLHMHGPTRRALIPVLMSVAEKFSVDSEEFHSTVSVLEKLTFKYNLLKSNGAQNYENAVQRAANKLYWSDISDQKIEKIFNTDANRYKGFQSKELGIKKLQDNIRDRHSDIAPVDELVSDYLSEPDVLQGEFTSGWGGVRNKETIKYLLYEHEMWLSDRTGQLSLAAYEEFRDNFQVEHLVPKNAEAGHQLENHKRNRNRIGNLAVVSAEDNLEKGNQSYQSKYQSMYKDARLRILSSLPEGEMSIDDIERREKEELFPFIRERWSRSA